MRDHSLSTDMTHEVKLTERKSDMLLNHMHIIPLHDTHRVYTRACIRIYMHGYLYECVCVRACVHVCVSVLGHISTHMCSFECAWTVFH